MKECKYTPYEWLACECNEEEQTIFSASTPDELAHILDIKVNTLKCSVWRDGRIRWRKQWIKVHKVAIK